MKNSVLYSIIILLGVSVIGLLSYIFIPHLLLMNHNDMDMMEMGTEQSDSPFIGYSKAMNDHCKIMPEMSGCEPYNILVSQKSNNVESTSEVNISELMQAKKVEIVELRDGDTYDMEVTQVRKEIGNDSVMMLAYNGSIPGPILKAPEGTKVTINFVNKVPDLETTLHSHGLRGDYTMDGVPKEMMGTQDPVAFGESFQYELEFPDTGIFWYHPHIREDIQQELGLSGNFIVTPKDANYWNPVNREETLILDDVLIEDGKIAEFSQDFANYILMGRFGNTMLVNGETDYSLNIKKGEVVRLNLTNVSNTRIYNFEIPGAKIKRVGGDIGKYERDSFVESIVIAPAERYSLEVYFPESGEFEIQNNTPVSNYTLGKIVVSDGQVENSYLDTFNILRENTEIIADIDAYRSYFDTAPDKEIELDMDMNMNMGNMMMEGESHGGIEWEDEMGMMNKMHNSNQVDWKITDKITGKENMNINWNFNQGDVVKVRIHNKKDGTHPMQHPIHFHGQRFLVLNENGKQMDNLVWKDTALVKTGEYIDILIDMSNPGEWMVHCHIAEHLSAGMMMHFSVKEN